MIAFVKGFLDTVLENAVLVENNEIGYEVKVPGSVISRLPKLGSRIKLYTYTYVREDILQLYGFLSNDELKMFKLLITVNGVGPKAALSILSIMSADELRIAVVSGDTKSIGKASGIGPKTASKVILELKDKCKIEDFIENQFTDAGASEVLADDAVKEAIQALVALGYSDSDAVRAVRKVPIQEDMKVQEILKMSLKNL